MSRDWRDWAQLGCDLWEYWGAELVLLGFLVAVCGLVMFA